MSKYSAIVLSAGTGSRMKSDIPKQYMDLLGKPVICYSLEAFQNSDVDEIILVAGEADIDYCRTEIVGKYGYTKVKAVVAGGKERYHSVCRGLEAIKELGGADYVMIHDGARPLLDGEMIRRLQSVVEQEKACVLGMPVKDTIKIADEFGYAAATPDRRYVWLVQTPQVFDFELILDCYQKLMRDIEEGREVPAVTDDTMVAEFEGHVLAKLVEGSYKNLKITTPEDLDVAALYLSQRASRG